MPQRRWRMDRLYSDFVRRGDLVFDIGSHVGDRIGSFRRLGCNGIGLHRLFRVPNTDRGIRFAHDSPVEGASSPTRWAPQLSDRIGGMRPRTSRGAWRVPHGSFLITGGFSLAFVIGAIRMTPTLNQIWSSDYSLGTAAIRSNEIAEFCKMLRRAWEDIVISYNPLPHDF